MKDLNKIVKRLIREDAREEANKILSLATDTEKNQFLDYWQKKQHNVCCMVLDTIKNRLVIDKKMKQHSKDAFGGELI